MAEPLLSVVVPCYNEAANLNRGVLHEMYDYLQSQGHPYEVVISDDGSLDESVEIIKRQIAQMPTFRLVENVHGGKPWAVWQGIGEAKGEIILFTDMDQSTPIDQIEELLPYFDQGYDVVIGSRGMTRKDFPLYRRLGSAVFAAFRRLLLLPEINDTQCGFKALRSCVARAIFPQISEISQRGQVKGRRVTAFDVELLYLAERAGYRIAEVPVAWSNRDVGESRVDSYVHESVEMAKQVLRIKWKELRGEYGERLVPR